uniref:Uncharacterized protein n=1 Tax=Tetranychus urticae TaxID=32264 RepID=T1K7R8_TETUR
MIMDLMKLHDKSLARETKNILRIIWGNLSSPRFAVLHFKFWSQYYLQGF